MHMEEHFPQVGPTILPVTPSAAIWGDRRYRGAIPAIYAFVSNAAPDQTPLTPPTPNHMPRPRVVCSPDKGDASAWEAP